MKHSISAVGLLLLVTSVSAQSREVVPDEREPFALTESARVALGEDIPRVVFGTNYRPVPSDPESMAREFLRARGEDLKIDEAVLALTAIRETPGGQRVRFEQVVDGYPVFQSDVVVTLSHDGRVAFLVNGFKPGIVLRDVASKTGSVAAVATVSTHLGLTEPPKRERSELVVYASSGRARLAHRVEVVPGRQLFGDWEVLVDAATGEVFRAVNRAQGHKGPHAPVEPVVSPRERPAAVTTKESAARVDGVGWVFDPDPLSTAMAAYGGDYVDNDDQDAQVLTDQLVEVTLRDFIFDGTNNFLQGPYARVTDTELPFDGTFEQDSTDFRFTRGQDQFEATNTYYHLDKSIRYINETLNFTLMPYQYSGGVLFDPHGWDGNDQSSYSTFEGLLSFGEGGVDDAEDADVILHELGHGLHDWLTNGGLSQVDGLSEGVGDYWANSYHRSLGLWPDGSDEEAWVFHWDGHNEYWGGRTTAYDAHYPDELVDQIHTDGQMWAASMMEVWEQLGRETTDLLFLEGLSMTGSTTSQADAVFAVLQADTLLNAGANAAILLDVFGRRGYLMRANFASSVRAGPPPLAVQFFDASFAIGAGITGWAWDFDSDGTTDSTSPLASHTYQEPGLYDVTLTVTSALGETTLRLEDHISVNQGIYLWQGGPEQFDRSGDFLRNHFLLRKFDNAYAGSAVMHAPLTGYDAVFLSLGSFVGGATELSDFMATNLRTFIEAGGHVYLDGAEALGFDQAGNSALLALFGLDSTDDGSGATTPVVNMVGQAGSLGENMTFSGTTQLGNTFIDVLNPSVTGRAVFEESVGTVAVQHENPGGGRTFAMSYALGHLEDGVHPSTRTELIDRILSYFGFDPPTSTEEDGLPDEFALTALYPNPVSSTARLEYRLPAPARVRLSLYNLLGQRVAQVQTGELVRAGSHETPVDVSTLPSGTYMAVLEANGQTARQTLVVVR